MQILFLSAHLPSARAHQAGQKTSYHICEWLARRHEVHLLSFATEDEVLSVREPDNGIFHCWETVPVTNWTRLSGIVSAPFVPISVAVRHSRRFRERLYQLLSSHKIDVAILDHTAMWQYAGQFSDMPSCVGSAHDCLTQAWERRLARAPDATFSRLFKIETKRTRNWERDALGNLAFVIVQSEKDSTLLGQLNPNTQRFVIHPWVSIGQESSSSVAGRPRKPDSIVFWGALDRAENRDAVAYIVRDILPRVREQVPNATLYVAGSHSESIVSVVQGIPQVVLTGFIDNIREFLSGMQVALLPLRLGAGIKVKTLECMAAGLPVVTTSVGAEGIGADQGVHYWVEQDPNKLAERTVQLLRAPEAGLRMGELAQEFFFSQFDFYRPLDALEAWIAQGHKIPSGNLALAISNC
jgi:polysaccharide biosynthesis protein PslH